MTGWKKRGKVCAKAHTFFVICDIGNFVSKSEGKRS